MPVSKRVKHSDKGRGFATLGAERSADRIQDGYKNHGLPFLNALKKLEKGDRQARLMAGNLAVEAGYRVSTLDETAEWLQRAEQNFQVVVRNGELSSKKMDDLQARALLQLAQMPNHVCLAGPNVIPPLDVAAKSYEKSIEVAYLASAAFQSSKGSGSDRYMWDLAGTLTEASVLLLAQRYAIWGIGDGSWMAMPALFSEDHMNGHGNVVDKAWDMNVLTDVGDGIETAYKVQIKSSSSVPSRREGFAEGISPLYARPDLLLQPEVYSGKFSVSTIITECYMDYFQACPRSGSRLDQRAELLLDVLDRPVS